jgi:ectoine hydroxylase-related dioxygenase (phytanoyl-CoA dioxygenase family)
MADLASDGYTVLEGAIEASLITELRDALGRLEADLIPANNDFEGRKTLRAYNLLAKGAIWGNVPMHENVLPVVEDLLGPECLISTISSVNIGVGETPQRIHADDGLIPLPKPHVATGYNTMWALTDFTEANGATRLVPGSHLADHSPEHGKHYDSIPAEMKAGSVLVWHSSLWHGGGANKTSERRIGIAMNYCAGWVRPLENQMFSVPFETLRTFPPRLQELCGFGLFHGIYGSIELRSPAAVLLGAGETRVPWLAS